MLTTVPAPRQDTEDKLSIIPDYILPYDAQQSIEITSDNLTAAKVTANPIRHLSTPDILYVNMSALTAYSNQPPKTINGIYGIYKVPGAVQGNQAVRVKQVSAPTWLLSLIL